MTIESIQAWHELARPTPNARSFDVQYGCHLEEVVEQLETLNIINNPDYKLLVTETFTPAMAIVSTAINTLHTLAECLKSGVFTATIEDRKGFADAVGDQVVTGIGAAHCANMNGTLIVERVNSSNWTKYVDGKPVFNEQGKIAKPDTYQPPDLTGTY